MPRYRLITHDGKTARRADDAIDLPNDRVAADEAQKALVNIASDALPDGPKAEFRVRVENELGEDVYRASLNFRGQTQDEIRDEAEERERLSDAAADAVVKALSAS